MNNNKVNRFSALLGQLKKEREKVKKLEALIEDLSKEESLYERVKDDPCIKQKIVSEYLRSLSEKGGVALISGGVTALTPVHRPKNLQEAKKLAEKIIKS